MRLLLTLTAFFLCQCASAKDYKELTVPYVDLANFDGDWFVQGHIHLWLDQGAINQVENYQMKEDGKIGITFSYLKELGGETTSHHPKAWVVDYDTNAHWKVQFLWPFTSNFLVVRLAEDYSWTVISVPNKDLIWIMSRDRLMSDEQYESIVSDLRVDGYEVDSLERVQQIWP